MTLYLWRILCLASAAVVFLGVIILLCSRLLKNKYYFSYHEDELIKTEKTSNSKNSLYFTSGETKKFIKKYVICKSAYDRYLICNYAKEFNEIIFYVIQYTARKKVAVVLRVEQCCTEKSSKIIALHKNCAYVNVIIGSADGTEINSSVIRPLPKSKIRLSAAIKSMLLFAGLFVVRHAIIELFGGIYIKQYLDNFLNYAAIAGSFLLAVISYFVTVLCFRLKNAKERSGGVLEYEFV